jgi:hypothetical protein
VECEGREWSPLAPDRDLGGGMSGESGNEHSGSTLLDKPSD